jgi:hypothetical protein
MTPEEQAKAVDYQGAPDMEEQVEAVTEAGGHAFYKKGAREPRQHGPGRVGQRHIETGIWGTPKLAYLRPRRGLKAWIRIHVLVIIPGNKVVLHDGSERGRGDEQQQTP